REPLAGREPRHDRDAGPSLPAEPDRPRLEPIAGDDEDDAVLAEAVDGTPRDDDGLEARIENPRRDERTGTPPAVRVREHDAGAGGPRRLVEHRRDPVDDAFGGGIVAAR